MKIVKNKHFLCIFFIFSSFLGCKKFDNYQFGDDPEILQINWSLVGGRNEIEEIKISSNEEVKNIINQLIYNEKFKGWKISYVSYAPQMKITSKNNEYTITLIPEKVIVNYKVDSRKYVQIEKRPSIDYYQKLINVLYEGD